MAREIVWTQLLRSLGVAAPMNSGTTLRSPILPEYTLFRYGTVNSPRYVSNNTVLELNSLRVLKAGITDSDSLGPAPAVVFKTI